MSPRGRRGLGLLELSVAIGLAALVSGAAIALMSLASRAERQTSGCADAAVQAALAHDWMSRDLARAHVDPDGEPSPVVESGRDARLDLIVLADEWGAPAQRVRWRFDPARGRLERESTDRAPMSFPLGPGSSVAFARGEALEYRITTLASGPGSTSEVTLTGALALEVATSRAAFPGWN